jgi:hypothetical protein
MNKMRTIPDMITDLRSLSDDLRGSPEGALLHDAANYIEGATENLCQHAEQLKAMRLKLEQARPLMEQVVDKLEQEINILYYHRNENPYHMRLYTADMELPRAIKSMLRWWEPGAAEPASISHWGIVK